MQRLRDRWGNLPISDPVQYKIAMFFQTILVAWVALGAVGAQLIALRGVLTRDPQAPAAPPEGFVTFLPLLFIAIVMLFLAPAAALVLLRRGRYDSSVATATWGILGGHTIAHYVFGFSDPSIMVVYLLPIAIAGLIGGRRLLRAVVAYSIAAVVVLGWLATRVPPQAGFIQLSGATGVAVTLELLIQPILFFVVITLLIGLLLSFVGGALRDALRDSQRREQELEAIRGSLEQTVGERTLELEDALRGARQQAEAQAALLAEVSAQREIIREMSVPVLPISDSTLVMPLVGALDGTRLRQVQEQALGRLQSTRARALLLDITGVPIVDTEIAYGLVQVIRAARLLGAEVALVGIRPEVAQSIVGLGLQFEGVRAYGDLQSALRAGVAGGGTGPT